MLMLLSLHFIIPSMDSPQQVETYGWLATLKMSSNICILNLICVKIFLTLKAIKRPQVESNHVFSSTENRFDQKIISFVANNLKFVLFYMRPLIVKISLNKWR
jgi:hypothetical protein